ncbi:TonB dependent receptor [compost metagenome]
MTNQNSLIPTEGGQSQYGVYSSRVLEDASYLRLKTLSLGYSLPVNIIRKIGLKAMNVSLAMQNVLTWTKYSGMDPEVAVRSTALTPGFDYSAYPHSRTTTFKVSATF